MWIIVDKPVSIHARKALFNHILTWVCFTLAPLALMLSASVMGNASTNTENLDCIWLMDNCSCIGGSRRLFVH